MGGRKHSLIGKPIAPSAPLMRGADKTAEGRLGTRGHSEAPAWRALNRHQCTSQSPVGSQGPTKRLPLGTASQKPLHQPLLDAGASPGGRCCSSPNTFSLLKTVAKNTAAPGREGGREEKAILVLSCHLQAPGEHPRGTSLVSSAGAEPRLQGCAAGGEMGAAGMETNSRPGTACSRG